MRPYGSVYFNVMGSYFVTQTTRRNCKSITEIMSSKKTLHIIVFKFDLISKRQAVI